MALCAGQSQSVLSGLTCQGRLRSRLNPSNEEAPVSDNSILIAFFQESAHKINKKRDKRKKKTKKEATFFGEGGAGKSVHTRARLRATLLLTLPSLHLFPLALGVASRATQKMVTPST